MKLTQNAGVMRPFQRLLSVSILVVLCLALVSCHGKISSKPERITHDPHASGDNQCAFHGEELPIPLRVMVESPTVPGLLGGKGSRHPVPGVTVKFSVDNPESGAVFSESGNCEYAIDTNAAGNASASLRMGNRSGDVIVTASIETEKGPKSVEFRALGGAQRVGEQLEAPTGGTIDEVGFVLQDPDGSPAERVAVYFRVEGNGHKAKVGGGGLVCVKTDADGRAVTSWTMGEKLQQYFLSVEIRDRRQGVDPAARFDARAVEFEAMAVDKRQMVVQLFGGLAVFILGMRWMSGGLRRMADRRLKKILQAMTRNRFMATGVGAGLTAVVQSSSATTVMTVGFVNAGLMTLTQAIGVVYGANIGTTITAQIIAFKLDALAYPAIAVGLVITMACRRPALKAFGEAILGFGLLFLGMTTMSSILKPLRYSPEFQSWFQIFDCTPDAGGMVKAAPALMCILVGTIATVVVQSSSATVGLVLALSGQGLVGFYTAVPLVLGDNIGTTITALLASLGANRNAKRTAVAHAMFNVFGATYMYVLLFLPFWNGQPLFLGFVDWLTPGDVFAAAPENVVRHVANAHTSFNVINCVLFLPFVGTMAKVCQKIVPMTLADKAEGLAYLEPHLLDSPSLALQQAVKEVAYMVRRAQKSINEGCALFHGGSRELETKIGSREELIDRLQQEITAYLVELSRRNLTPQEATLLPALVHAVNDAERIGDHSENLVELTHLKIEGGLRFTPEARDELRRMEGLLEEQFEGTINSLVEEDPSQVDRVLDAEREITEFVAEVQETHVKRLEAGQCSVQAGVVFLDLIAQLERVGDHLCNIAERAGKIIQVTN